MPRRVIRPCLEMRDRFETTRLGQQCLRDAYARLVPLRCEVTGKNRCIAPGCLDNRLRYAARLKVSSCQAARIWAGLRYPFFSISHSAL